MKDFTEWNKKRWQELVANEVICSNPLWNITAEDARQRIDPHDLIGSLEGQKVLCLASGGGQQSIAFAALGAEVTVTDFSSGQLAKDKLAAEKQGFDIRLIESDMRDFSPFAEAEFDVIYQPYSINYVPDVAPVFDGVRRSLKTDGWYYLMFHNPVTHGSWPNGSWGGGWQKEDLWRGQGYPLRLPYQEGLPIEYEVNQWIFHDRSGRERQVAAPQEFKHTLGTVLNGLTERGLHLLKFEEIQLPDREELQRAEPGSWAHYRGYAAPWLAVWMRKADV